jgi:uncharacterized protein with HEPN domain
MFDRDLALDIVRQINEALDKIKARTVNIKSVEDFTTTPSGMEKLDGVCMLFMAIGEALKNLDKVTEGSLLVRYPEIDWKGAMGFRDIIAHHYFDVDAEQVFWICTHQVLPLSETIKKMIQELRDK